GRPGATALNIALGIEQLNADDPNTGMGRSSQICCGLFDGIDFNPDVGIHKQQKRGIGFPSPLIACCREAKIIGIDYHLESHSPDGKPSSEPILRGVVNDDDIESSRDCTLIK